MARKGSIIRKETVAAPLGALFALDTLNLELRRLNSSGKHGSFGPMLSRLFGRRLSSAVVLHRLTKAYEVPIKGQDDKRKERSISAVLQRDEEGFDMPSFSSPRDRKVLLRVRRFITSTAAHLRPSYQLVFPTGESFTSLHGEKDLYFKLENMDVWECNPGAFRYVSEIFYRNPHMKRLVKKRFYEKQLTEFGFDRKTVARQLYQRLNGNGRKTFRQMLSFLVRLVDVSRMTTVPKDNSKDRVITCEPFLTMIAQLSYMHDMRCALRRATGLDLRVLQDWHGARIRDKHIATLDLRNASNQVWLSAVKVAFGGAPAVLKQLLALRSGTTQYGTDYHHFNMYSPMGCGLTFDVMTWLLLAIVRAHDPSGSVFGDDILCKARIARQVTRSLELFGLEVNSDKSFSTGYFRESCGYYADVRKNRFITCYDLRRPTTLFEMMVVCNKLRDILINEPLLPSIEGPIRRAWVSLIRFLPRDAYLEVPNSFRSIEGGVVFVPPDEYDTTYFYDRDWQRLRPTTRELVPFRDLVGGLVTLTLDTVRMLHLRDPRISGANKVRYKWKRLTRMG